MSTGDLNGQVAVVTGGSRGIGEAIAIELARQGAAVVITSRKADAVEAAADRVRASVPGTDVVPLAAHVADEAAATEVMNEASSHGSLSILVNNAATNPYMGPLLDIDGPRAAKTTDVNLLGPVVWSRAARDAGLAEGGGAIVNIASIGGLRIDPGIGYYNATKAALIHVTRQLSYELGPDIRVNAVAPGLVKTELARALWEEHEESISAALPLRRLGTVEDIAAATAFLAGPRSAWITGHTLVVDGGAMVNPVIADSTR